MNVIANSLDWAFRLVFELYGLQVISDLVIYIFGCAVWAIHPILELWICTILQEIIFRLRSRPSSLSREEQIYV